MKDVNKVTDPIVMDLTIHDSSFREANEKAEDEKQKKTFKILNSICCHSENCLVTESQEDLPRERFATIDMNGGTHIPSENVPNGHITRSVSEIALTALPNNNVYFIPMPSDSATSVVSQDSCYPGEVDSYTSTGIPIKAASLDSGVCDILDSQPPDHPELNDKKQNLHLNTDETGITIALQVILPFLIAGIGTCGAGLLLDQLQSWAVFKNVEQLFAVVTPLLGLKGNLEMTLASRLSTQANLGNLNSFSVALKQGWGNMVLKLAQATVMGLIAALFAIIVNIKYISYEHALLLCCSSLGTATITTIMLGSVTTTVVSISHFCKINPDNIATPIAASLGDVATLGVLALIAREMYKTKENISIPIAAIAVFLIMVPFWIYCAKQNEYTRQLILTGWIPIIGAVAITSGGGVILESALKEYEGMAVFQPVINGIGGNLVAVQASRICTYLHQRSKLGELPSDSNTLCISPCSAFFGKSDHSRTAIILMMLVVPGHLIFAYSIHAIKEGNTSLSAIFTPIYLTTTVLQVAILLYVAHCMIHWMWKWKCDPDNAAIPLLTALGDLLGTALLATAFYVFTEVNKTKNSALTSPTQMPTNTTYSQLLNVTGSS